MATPFPFTAGQVLTAAQMNSITELIINDKTASYTLVAGDAGEYVVMNSASATTITVPNNVFTASQIVRIVNKGAGVCTVTAGAGTTVSTTGTLALAQNAVGTLIALSASAFIYEAGGTTSAVAQVKSTAKTDTFSTSSTSFTDVTGLSVSITPTSASNKVLVMVSVSGTNHVQTAIAYWKLLRDSTDIAIGGTAGNRIPVSMAFLLENTSAMDTGTLVFLDSPATTSATTYKLQACNGAAGTLYVNRSQFDADAATAPRGISTITVMEVAP